MGGEKTDYAAALGELKSKYDGVIIRQTMTDSPDRKTPIDQYLVFDSNQIKSAISSQFSSDLDGISESDS